MILHAHERGAGAGPPVVLLHGLFGRAANFATVQGRLAATRRVIALDLRNHGASPHAAGMDYPTMAEDVAETLQALTAWPCVLVGHSMGGKVAMMLALRRPVGVARLLVADIAPVRYPPHFRAYAEAMRGLPLTPGLIRPQADAALAPAIPDPVVRRFLLQNLRTGAAPGWTCGLADIAAALPDIEDWPDPGTAYDGPVLFLAGARSDYISPETRPAIYQHFPRARLVTLRNAGHWLHADDPDGFLSVVDAFAPVSASAS